MPWSRECSRHTFENDRVRLKENVQQRVLKRKIKTCKQHQRFSDEHTYWSKEDFRQKRHKVQLLSIGRAMGRRTVVITTELFRSLVQENGGVRFWHEEKDIQQTNTANTHADPE